MTEPTPQHHLADLLADLCRELPSRYATLLAAPDFATGRAALEALGRPGRIAAVAADLRPAEAAWMVEELSRRWEHLLPKPLPPTQAARLLCPDVLWLAGDRTRLRLEVTSRGLADGWQVIWPTGAEPLGPAEALLTVTAEDAPSLALHARIVGRRVETGERDVLHALAQIAVLRPVLDIALDRRSIRVHDGGGRPAAGLEIGLDGRVVALDGDGALGLDDPLPPDAAVTCDGIALTPAGDGG